MYPDPDSAQANVKAVLADLGKAIADAGEDVESRHLDRLVIDRDKAIHVAYTVNRVTVTQLARWTGIPWPQIYDIADRVSRGATAVPAATPVPAAPPMEEAK